MSSAGSPHWLYEGPPSLRQPILDALDGVIDPEVAMSIVDVGLVDSVSVTDQRWAVRLTMTSAACPVSDLVAEEVGLALERIAPPGTAIEVDVALDPPWTPERMSERGRRMLKW
jgi:metal-sulfur cluster biosynthetic enzyme